MALSILGCQGYEAPKYKSPDDAGEEELEEVEIDVSDIDEEFEEDELLEDEDDWWDEEDEETDEEIESFTPADDSGYTPATKEGEESEEEEAAEEEETDFEKSPYRSVVEDDLPTLTVTEGQLVKLNVKATDADGDPLTYTFEAPLNSEGKWQTRSGDSGVYYPMITVSDGKTDVDKQIKIVVEPKNNKPVLQFIPDVEVNEGETVSISARATDADGDRLTYEYSGWMTSATKETDYNDAGEHTVVVSVTDGISTVSQEVTVTVNDVNRPPEVEIEF
jgi:hypothetical protein